MRADGSGGQRRGVGGLQVGVGGLWSPWSLVWFPPWLKREDGHQVQVRVYRFPRPPGAQREREENIIWGLTCYNTSPHRGVPAKLLFLVHVVSSLRPARHCDRPSPEMND